MAPAWLQRACAAAIAWRIRRLAPAGSSIPLGIFKADRVGDLILAQGAIRTLLRSVNVGDSALITSDVAAEAAAELFPDVQRIVVTERGIVRGLPRIWKSVESLRAFRFDRLVCFQHHRSATQGLFLRAAEAEWSVGCGNARRQASNAWERACERSFSTEVPYPEEAAELPRELEAHGRVTEMALARPVDRREILPEISMSVPASRHLLLSPFASHPIRDYPADLLEAALMTAQAGIDMPIRIIGSPSDDGRIRAMAARMASAGLRDVAPLATPSFKDYASAVASAKLVLTMETGTAHLATAMDKEAIVILGGGHFGLLGPWSRSARQVWLSHRVPCYGCDWRCTQPEVTCITGIRADGIAAALRAHWVGQS